MSPDAHASMHAINLSLSPIKSGGTFFDGELTDGIKIIRLVDLNKNQHAKLQDFHLKQAPVTLGNCQIQFNKLTGNKRNIQPSDAKFMIHNAKTFGSDMIKLAALQDKNKYDKVTVKAWVLKITDPAEVESDYCRH